jgi:hypothetical protein
MSVAAVFAIAPAMGPSFGGPSRAGRGGVTYWLNAAYLGIGELALAWPVAAFLRAL